MRQGYTGASINNLNTCISGNNDTDTKSLKLQTNAIFRREKILKIYPYSYFRNKTWASKIKDE